MWSPVLYAGLREQPATTRDRLPEEMDILNAMAEIKKAILHGAGDLRIESEPYDLGTLKTDEIFVRTEVTGFSTGTDLGNYEGRSTEVPNAPGYPRGVGYSNVGVVQEVGSAVHSFQPGDCLFSMKHHQSAYIAKENEVLVRIPEGADVEEASLAYLVISAWLRCGR